LANIELTKGGLISEGILTLVPFQSQINPLHKGFLSGGFTTVAIINPPERKLAKRTSVH
jgi:hypothetical protein